MKSEKYNKIYSSVIRNLDNALQTQNTEELFNGIDEYLIDRADIDLLKKMYLIQIPEADSISLLAALAINAKMLKYVFIANAAEAFTTLRRNKEWHMLYHSFVEVMPDDQIFKQCYPVQRLIFDANYCDRVQQNAKMICGKLFDKLYGKISKSFDYTKSRLLQVIFAKNDDEAESMDLLINEKRAVNLMYISGILDDAIGSVLAQKYYSLPEEQRGAFMLRLTELAQRHSPTTLMIAEILNDLFVHEDNMEDNM